MALMRRVLRKKIVVDVVEIEAVRLGRQCALDEGLHYCRLVLR